ncbi:MAG: tetratricopeptide repeat protein [Oligoflexus sp.]
MIRLWPAIAANIIISLLVFSFTSTTGAAEEQVAPQPDEAKVMEEQKLREDLQNFPQDFRIMYNLGVNLYEQQRFAEAAALFQQAAATDDDRLRSQALFNKGMSEFEQKQYQQTLETWRSALSHQLDDTIIAENLQWLEEHLERMEEQEKQTQQNPDEQQDEQNIDQENQEKSNQDGEKQQGNQDEQDIAEQKESDSQPQSSDQSQENQNSQSESMANEENQQQQDADSQQSENSNSQMAEQDPEEESSDGSALNPNQQMAAEQEGEEQVLTQEQMEIQDAQKLIRSVEDKVGRYHIPIDRETLRRRQSKNAW